VSGIGNAYSDEILHAAQLSPITLTHKLRPVEWQRLFSAARQTLEHWVHCLQAEAGTRFPEKVTGPTEGDFFHPFNTLTAAVNAVAAGGVIKIVPGWTNERPTFAGKKRYKIVTPIGGVRIGVR
jgi:hypothetical protein